jgi:hypothetical protein
MQINVISTPISIAAEKLSLPRTSSPTVDQTVLNHSVDFFSSLVKKASQMPEVRSDVVIDFKARIQSNNYPSPDIIDGLSKLIGNRIMKNAKLNSCHSSCSSAAQN